MFGFARILEVGQKESVEEHSRAKKQSKEQAKQKGSKLCQLLLPQGYPRLDGSTTHLSHIDFVVI